MSPMVTERKPFNADDRLKDYVAVNERIAAFYERYPDGCLQAEPVPEWSSEERICMVAYAYRTADDPKPGKGYSWLEIPGRTPYTRGSEIENAETSAWGRAIASLGFEVKRGIATAEDVRIKEDHGEPEPPVFGHPPGQHVLTGTVAGGKQAPSDMLLRQTPDGAMFGFVLVGPEGRGRTQVIAIGPLADDIWDAIGHDGNQLFNREVTVTGHLERVEWKKDGRDMPPYRRLRLTKLRTPDWTLPDEPPEPDTIPLFEEAS